MSPPNEVRFRGIYEEHHRAVLAYCLRRVGADDAYDACADTFVVAWRRLGEVPDGEDALLWLYGVARRVLANRQRSARRLRRMMARVTGLGVPSPKTPESVVLRREEERKVLEALRRLRPADQEVLRLAVWEELPHDGIAGMLGCSRDAVDKRLQRARRRLLQEMQRFGYRLNEPGWNVEGPTMGGAK